MYTEKELTIRPIQEGNLKRMGILKEEWEAFNSSNN